MQETPVQAPGQRDRGRREEAQIFAGMDAPLRLACPELREEPLRERVRRDEPEREDRHPQQAVEELRDVAPRRRRALRGDRAHHPLRVVQRERFDRDVRDLGVDVQLQAPLVVRRRTLLPDVIGVKPGELAGGPALPSWRSVVPLEVFRVHSPRSSWSTRRVTASSCLPSVASPARLRMSGACSIWPAFRSLPARLERSSARVSASSWVAHVGSGIAGRSFGPRVIRA